MVVAAHTSSFFKPEAGWLRMLAPTGSRGVQLFYIVSAFTLSLTFSARVRDLPYSRAIVLFWRSRLFRIIPLFYLAVVVSVIVFGFGPRYWAPDGLSWRDVVLTFSFLNAWDPHSITSVVEGGWSVALEMNFYLFFPLFFVLSPTPRRAAAGLGLALVLFYLCRSFIAPLVIRGWPASQAYIPASYFDLLSLPAELPIFFVGLILFRLHRPLHVAAASFPYTRTAAYFLVVLATGIFYWASATPYHTTIPKHFEHTFALTMLVVAVSIYPVEPLVNKITQYLGRISFSVYLTHHYVIVSAEQFLGNTSQGHSAWLCRYPFALALIILITVAISHLTYCFIEEPFRRWGRSLPSNALPG